VTIEIDTEQAEQPAPIEQPDAQAAGQRIDPIADRQQGADIAEAEQVDTFSAEYVTQLREESAAHRVKAKRIDSANDRLVAAYAAADGRLVDVEALAFDEALLDGDGLVDRAKVVDAIAALIEAKPYLASRTPATVLPQGVRADAPAAPGLFDFIRDRV
jgi:hypothetical protein